MLVLDLQGIRRPGQAPVTSKASEPQREQAFLTTGPAAVPQARSPCLSLAPGLASPYRSVKWVTVLVAHFSLVTRELKSTWGVQRSAFQAQPLVSLLPRPGFSSLSSLIFSLVPSPCTSGPG